MKDMELTPPVGKAKAEAKVEAKAEARAEAKAPTPVAPAPVATWPKYLRSSTSWAYADPETGIRYEPHIPVRVDAEPRVGCWLDCQMKAGYIIEA
jgi:hypothetical protein